MKWQHENGQLLAGFFAFFFLVYFAATIFLFFLYKESLFRFEFGPEKKKEQELVFDKNRVLELIRKERFLKEEVAKVAKEKEQVEALYKQIEIEKQKLGEDKQVISAKMEEISQAFQKLSTEEEENLRRLASVYAKMKADRVATIFKRLDLDTTAALLERMQDKVSAKILGQIALDDSGRAASISNLMQHRVNKESFGEIP